MATHCRVLAWRSPGTEEPGGLRSMGAHSRTAEATKLQQQYHKVKIQVTNYRPPKASVSTKPRPHMLCLSFLIFVFFHILVVFPPFQ